MDNNPQQPLTALNSTSHIAHAIQAQVIRSELLFITKLIRNIYFVCNLNGYSLICHIRTFLLTDMKWDFSDLLQHHHLRRIVYCFPSSFWYFSRIDCDRTQNIDDDEVTPTFKALAFAWCLQHWNEFIVDVFIWGLKFNTYGYE